MNIRKVKKAAKRIDTTYLADLKIKSYGANNLYPQDIANIIKASSTGAACCDRYARFIEGDGFANIDIAQMVMARNGATANDVLTAVAHDLATFGGFALHVNYNAFCQISEVQHIAFEQLRLKEPDDSGYIGMVAQHPDWSGRQTRMGRRLVVNKDTVKWYNLFNPRPDVVRSQIVAAGGIDGYSGQVLYVGERGRIAYPTPKADRVVTDLSTDEGLANIKYRNTRCNFLTSQMLITKVDQVDPDGQSAEGFASAIEQFQGDERANAILQMTVTSDEEKPEIVPFNVRNYDKDFTVTDQSVVERIYCAYEQEPFLAVRNGKLGFSGDVVTDAFNYYSFLVRSEQRQICRAFAAVLELWHEPLANADVVINPLKFLTE